MERKQKKEVIENMTEKAKKREKIENAAEKLVLLPESDRAYIFGYMNGVQEERAKWVKKQEQTVNA